MQTPVEPLPRPGSQDATVAVEFAPDRPTLLLAFGGIAAQLGFVFEFKNITTPFESVNKVYLRDARRQWYHGGLEGVVDDVGGIVTFLRQYTGHPATKRCVAFGNSGGGYAALLFGHLLGVDEVHSISPQTRIDPLWRLVRGETRQWRRILRLMLNPRAEGEYFDLRELLSRKPNGRTSYHIHYSEGFEQDRRHARRMSAVAQVRLHGYEHGGHNLVRMLRDTGQLEQMIAAALGIEA